MKVVGIIVEYNPFHKGHKYQIEQLRQQTNADYIVVAMSGNFLQRGTPALCDKYTRAQMALDCGVDLVLELPTLWATASAEYFAKGGVELLSKTGVVTHLGFGAETEDLSALSQIASILKKEPDVYRDVLSNSIRSGNPFPVARKNALITSLPFVPAEKLDELVDTPNNILALEYLKALPESITPVLIPRKGSGYHDTDLDNAFPSASAIRNAIFENPQAIDMDPLSFALPEESFHLLKDCIERNALLETNDFSDMLGYILHTTEGYDKFADCTKDFSNKVQKNIPSYSTIEDFTQTLKSKDMTYTRVSRCLLHILLNIQQMDYQMGKAMGYIPYLRVLGFRSTSTELLSHIKQKSSVPLITKVADAESILDYESNKLFQKDLFASTLYYQCLARKTHSKPLNEFTHQLIIK